MTGGLLQLVAVGIDSIFITSNPSITLFKVVYRRYLILVWLQEQNK